MVFSKKLIQVSIAILVAFLPLTGYSITPEAAASTPAHAAETHAEPTDLKSKIRAFIDHHVLDAHDFSLFVDESTPKPRHYGFPLPIILWDNGVHFFSSSKFNHGDEHGAVAESNGNYYVLHHEKIYKTDAQGTLNLDEHHHPTNAKPIDLSITKGVLTIMVVALLMFMLFSGLAKSYAKNGGISSGPGRFFEPIVLYIRDEIAIPNIGEKHYKRYMSYLLTIFFFVWLLNIFGLTKLLNSKSITF
jgi:F-type H+-transporting ATPase subunit a